MENVDLQKVKERIAKLLAMAGDAASPNEAAIAAQRARALMDKYQLDEYDVSEAAPQEFSTEGVTRAFAAIPYHVDILSVAVARYNDCHALREWQPMTYKMESKANQNAKVGGGFTKSMGKRIIFRGYKNDVELARQMLDGLLAAIDSLCKKYMQANHPGKYNVRIGGDYKASAARAIIQSLDAMMVERQQLTATAGTSLVVIKAKHVDEHFGEVSYKSKSKSIAKGLDYEEQGWVDGSKVEIVKRLDD